MYDLFTNVAGDMKLIFLKEIRLYTKIYVLNVCQGRIQGGGGGAPDAPPPPKIVKKKIVLRKIVIFHTKYPKNFRASLRSAQIF